MPPSLNFLLPDFSEQRPKPAADMIAFVILAAFDAETAALIVAVTCEAD